MPQDWFEEHAAPPVDDWFAAVAPEVQRTLLRGKTWTESGTDLGVSVAKGVAGTGQAVVGLADLVSEGGAGRLVDKTLGSYSPRAIQASLDERVSLGERDSRQDRRSHSQSCDGPTHGR